LNLRTFILDRLVAAERGELNDGGRQGHALNLSEPEPWPEPVNGASLLDAIAANVRQHVVMFDHAADVVALWVVHTYLLDCFGISPRLAITSPEKGCGKTTALDVVSRLVRRPLSTANASAAAIFRVVELQRPTLPIDEAEAQQSLGGASSKRRSCNHQHHARARSDQNIADEHAAATQLLHDRLHTTIHLLLRRRDHPGECLGLAGDPQYNRCDRPRGGGHNTSPAPKNILLTKT
jgi:putative DNA primase/helicase